MSEMAIQPDIAEGEAAALLADLVSIDTQNPPGRERECAEFIHDTLADWGLDVEYVYEPFEDRPQVVARVGAAAPGSRTLLLNGHMDVVPPGDEAWTYDPFGGTIDDGKVYGRGASDMKAGLAAGMLAARAAERSGAVDGQLIVTFAVGEETGEPGTLRLVERLDADFGVVLEPTDLIVDTAGKGLAWYTVEVRGEPAHASKPYLAKNALEALLETGPLIDAYQAEIAERTHPLLGESIITPTVCRAGGSQNVIPGRAELGFDRRFIPEEDPEDLQRELAAVFDPLREEGFEVEVSVTKTYGAAEIPTDAEIAEVFRRHSASLAGIDTAPHGKIAATDQRHLVNDAGIPAIIWGPGTPTQAHTTDEWARVDLLEVAIPILCRAFDDLLVD